MGLTKITPSELVKIRQANRIQPGDSQTHLFRYLDNTNQSIGDLVESLLNYIEQEV